MSSQLYVVEVEGKLYGFWTWGEAVRYLQAEHAEGTPALCVMPHDNN